MEFLAIIIYTEAMNNMNTQAIETKQQDAGCEIWKFLIKTSLWKTLERFHQKSAPCIFSYMQTLFRTVTGWQQSAVVMPPSGCPGPSWLLLLPPMVSPCFLASYSLMLIGNEGMLRSLAYSCLLAFSLSCMPVISLSLSLSRARMPVLSLVHVRPFYLALSLSLSVLTSSGPTCLKG